MQLEFQQDDPGRIAAAYVSRTVALKQTAPRAGCLRRPVTKYWHTEVVQPVHSAFLFSICVLYTADKASLAIAQVTVQPSRQRGSDRTRPIFVRRLPSKFETTASEQRTIRRQSSEGWERTEMTCPTNMNCDYSYSTKNVMTIGTGHGESVRSQGRFQHHARSQGYCGA